MAGCVMPMDGRDRQAVDAARGDFAAGSYLRLRLGPGVDFNRI
jgi:hypothetical protein